MAEEGLDALVVRAPDNVLYLTNFWSMKGYEAVVFPREGEPVLICLEASAEDAARTAWTEDVRFLRGYADDDPRPPPARTIALAQAAAPGPRTRGQGRGRTARSASGSRLDPRPPTGWSASPRPSPTTGSIRSAWRSPTPRRSSPRRAPSRPSRSSSGCASPTRSP